MYIYIYTRAGAANGLTNHKTVAVVCLPCRAGSLAKHRKSIFNLCSKYDLFAELPSTHYIDISL